MKEVKEVVSMRQLLECGVHFGHQTKRWNPKMAKYIFTSRNGIHVIDLQQSVQLINLAYEFIKEIIVNDGIILFVGTKKQAQDAVKEESERCEMPFVNHRWLGGTLTNISTIRQSINKIKDFEKLKEEGRIEALSKKEQSKKTKAYSKLLYNLEGIKDMIKTPSAIFIVDTQKEQLAVKEARKLKIPIIAMVDTNANPNEIDYPIPANDDAIRAVKLICSIISNAVTEGKEAKLVKKQKQDSQREKEAKEKISSEKEPQKTEVKKTEAKKTEVKKPEVKKPEVKKPEVKKTEVKKTEVKKTEVKKPEAKKTEVKKSTPIKPGTAKAKPSAKKTEKKGK